jgi:hypothetical protein
MRGRFNGRTNGYFLCVNVLDKMLNKLCNSLLQLSLPISKSEFSSSFIFVKISSMYHQISFFLFNCFVGINIFYIPSPNASHHLAYYGACADSRQPSATTPNESNREERKEKKPPITTSDQFISFLKSKYRSKPNTTLQHSLISFLNSIQFKSFNSTFNSFHISKRDTFF